MPSQLPTSAIHKIDQSTCHGCGRTKFTATGFWSHLRQSKNNKCRNYYLKIQEQLKSESATAANLLISQESSAGASVNSHAGQDHAAGWDSQMEIDDIDFNLAAIPNHPESAEPEAEDDYEAEGDFAARLENLELENGWEAPRPPGINAEAQDGIGIDPNTPEDSDQAPHHTEHFQRASAAPVAIIKYSDQYPTRHPGAVIELNGTHDERYSTFLENTTRPWAPFSSRTEWEIARWAKLRGPGSTAFSELVAIPGVSEALGLSFKNAAQLDKIIDNRLPSARPKFERHEIVVANEAFEIYSRGIIECIRALWGNPDFAPDLIVEPERHYLDKDATIRIYHDMHTGRWWWSTQKAVEIATTSKNVTIVPLIISSDKTQLTTFRNKTAYPVYLTIGNLPKHIRRKPSRQGQILLAYLPTSKLDHISNKASRRRALANLFHASMQFITEPLKDAGENGILLESGEGKVRLGFPILAAYVADYPEQLLVTCVKSGECPGCPAHRDELGDPDSAGPLRDLDVILDALDTILDGPTAFSAACKQAGIKPIQLPFWQYLPFVNIYQSITPDLLHQLYQGVVKHIIAWLRALYGSDEIDARCRRLPPNHHIHLFLKGISHLSRVTGAEHDQISRFLLGIIIDAKIPGGHSNARVLKAVKGLLDFLNLAKYPVHTTETLDDLDAALSLFHKNKAVFEDLGIRNNFNIPKLHYLSHYRSLIEIFGTADNFNTEYTERLHIDLAKEAYRAMNCKDEYPQMTGWLDRRERILLHEKYLRRKQELLSNSVTVSRPPLLPPLVHPRTLKMAVTPSSRGVNFKTIEELYGTRGFRNALAHFIVHYQHPGYSRQKLNEETSKLYIPFGSVSVFHRIKYVSSDPYSLHPDRETTADSIHVEPAWNDKYGRLIPGRFDTALIRYQNEGGEGLTGKVLQ